MNFINKVDDQSNFNIINYPYFYDGGGIAIGDINNDGLPDIYFTSNLHKNRLYLNEGNFKFKDITETADVGGGGYGWTTGVTMADVNGDGLLDIYVCRVNYRNKKGRNQLFINKGDNTFEEKAHAYGLDFKGYGTQAAFFDYDKDGDLDFYLLNHSVNSNRNSIRRSNKRNKKDAKAGDKLFRNDSGKFVDVTDKAGIYSGDTGYGLGVAVSDINQNGWPDIYISNDFEEDDYLYINNGDGTFTEKLYDLMEHTSQASMGNDIADFNNDGRPDILTLDMRPEDRPTYQRSGGPDAYEIAKLKREYGYNPQLARNTLQINRGKDKNGNLLFSDIGALSGIEATDWSWAGLFQDFNLDGRKDLYITNGIYRRPNDLDYITFIHQRKIQRLLHKGPFKAKKLIIQHMPSGKVRNYTYKNTGNLSFQNKTEAWGLDQASFSNGAAYGDLDNDGDPDLVVNNVNMPAFIYRNNADSLTNNHFLKVKLVGLKNNTKGVGAKVKLKNNGEIWYKEQMPVRGFQSSVSQVLNFGLGNVMQIDTLEIIWPDDSKEIIKDITVDQQIELTQSKADDKFSYNNKLNNQYLFKDVTSLFNFNYKHQANKFNQFKKEPLMPHMLSTEGPALAVGDVNGDGLDDFFIGGGQNQAGRLFIQNEQGKFKKVNSYFSTEKKSEDIDAIFFDANGNKSLDLYVVSGGNEFSRGDKRYQDRLYINDRDGGFKKKTKQLPSFYANGSCVIASDFDGDGDEDLFVGSRSVPSNYGKSPNSYLLENDGSGTFTDVTKNLAPDLTKAGMVSDAKWADINGDTKPDLILIGEYMPITIYVNEGHQFENITQQAGLQYTNGWWNSLIASDLDGDGDIDLVAGNLGSNSVINISQSNPIKLLLNDFDNNGVQDPIITIGQKKNRYPLMRLHELKKQMPAIPQKFSSYEDFSNKSIKKIFSKRNLRTSKVKSARIFENSYFINDGKGDFCTRSLPKRAQFSPVCAMVTADINKDGHDDIIQAGNFHAVKPSEGRYDAGYGTFLEGKENGIFRVMPLDRSGLKIVGEARSMEIIIISGEKYLLIARNDQALQIFRIESSL